MKMDPVGRVGEAALRVAAAIAFAAPAVAWDQATAAAASAGNWLCTERAKNVSGASRLMPTTDAGLHAP